MADRRRRPTTTAASVTRTATDALRAKLSALAAGYDPVRPGGGAYRDALRRIGRGIEPESSSWGEVEGAAEEAAAERRRRRRRQTPLVNAGYASRVRAISSALCRWVSEAGGGRTDAVNVVLLGCGLDALGLWSSRLRGPSGAVRVYEVDCAEVCEAKAGALMSSGAVVAAAAPSTPSGGGAGGGGAPPSASVVLRGRIDIPPAEDGGGAVEGGVSGAPSKTTVASATESELVGKIGAAGTPCDYALLSADLRSVDSVRRALSESGLDVSLPTVAVSELVLAYLGRDGADSLLRYASSELCAAEGGLFVAYEPVGPGPRSCGGGTDRGPAVPTVVGGFAGEYLGRFRSKLGRGRHDRKDSNIDAGYVSEGSEEEYFHPLGTDPSDTVSRLVRCGFDVRGVGCCHAGNAAASYGPLVAPRLEHFDEHAALYLHLRCYVLVCAFSPDTDFDYIRRVCPWWSQQILSVRGASELRMEMTIGDGTTVTIAPIQSCDQEQVRELFRTTYLHLFDEYPSVKKMVKTALKTDLSGKRPPMNGRGAGNHQSEGRNRSAIQERYNAWGGGFWVATATADGPLVVEGNGCKVLGCVGLRPCSAAELLPRRLRLDGDAFEVRRLAVDAGCRGAGVGRALLAIAERFVVERGEDGEDGSGPAHLVATTPAVLEAANHFYPSFGFELWEEATTSKMKMLTYIKRIV